MSTDLELAIIGAGPAGMAAATMAAELNIEVAVFDEQPTPGGQVYRNAEQVARERPDDLDLLGPDYAAGLELIGDFRKKAIDYRPGTAVWDLNADGHIGILDNSGARVLSAGRIIIATGAAERPLPIPGGTLPGVMTAGAAQTLLKGSGLVPDGPVVLAGGGPLIYLVAWQLARAGVPIAAVLLTAPWRQRLSALAHLPAGLRDLKNLRKGRHWQHEAERAGTLFRGGVTGLSAGGDDCLRYVDYQLGDGASHRIECGLLLLHDGVIPNTQLSRVAGCAHVWDDRQRAWRPQTDIHGASSLDRVAVTGDGAGIGGAEAAVTRGHLAATDAARRLGRIDEPNRRARTTGLQHALARQLALRPFLDTWFRPADWLVVPPDDDTIVCRCEEVTAGELRRAAALGCLGPNQAKSFTRAGMGPCQGRMCGPVVSELMAQALGQSVEDTGTYRIRPPVKPLSVGEAAGLMAADKQ